MDQQENLLDKTTKEEEPKKSGGSWVSLLVSFFFIIRGFVYISQGTTTWGTIMLLVGVGGLGWKLYDMNKNR